MSESRQYTDSDRLSQTPALSGKWESTEWEFYVSETFPEPGVYTAAACVALRASGIIEVVLTCDGSRDVTDERYGKWEIPGGHVDPVNPADPEGPKETLEATVRREALEECGAQLGELHPFGYRAIYNPPSEQLTSRGSHPETSYMAYYWGLVDRPLRKPTEAKRHASGTFIPDSLETFERFGMIDPVELAIIRFGLTAAAQAREEGST
jgi:8-oxo-dGTP pyrophosphatase MutT (NUDIX family)